MEKSLLDNHKKAIAIVAHPDDETIWLGGMIMNYPKVDWTIFSLCRSDDADRAPKFKKVCEFYKAKAIISDLDDEDKLSREETIPIIKRLIKTKLKNKHFDYIFTHGKNGEYGHSRHIGVFEAVRALIEQKVIKPEAVFYFNYKKNKKNAIPAMITKKDSDLIINLSPRIFRKKKQIVAEMYGYPYNGIDVGLCTNPEAFLIKHMHKLNNNTKN